MPENTLCMSVKAHTEHQSSSEEPERRPKQGDEARQDQQFARNLQKSIVISWNDARSPPFRVRTKLRAV